MLRFCIGLRRSELVGRTIESGAGGGLRGLLPMPVGAWILLSARCGWDERRGRPATLLPADAQWCLARLLDDFDVAAAWLEGWDMRPEAVLAPCEEPLNPLVTILGIARANARHGYKKAIVAVTCALPQVVYAVLCDLKGYSWQPQDYLRHPYRPSAHGAPTGPVAMDRGCSWMAAARRAR